MNHTDKTINLSASGACKMRADLRALKLVNKLQKQEMVLIGRRVRAILGHWTIQKIKSVLGCDIESIERGRELILNKEITVEKFNELFQISAIFERLAKNDYKKTGEKNELRRLSKVRSLEKLKIPKRKTKSKTVFDLREPTTRRATPLVLPREF